MLRGRVARGQIEDRAEEIAQGFARALQEAVFDYRVVGAGRKRDGYAAHRCHHNLCNRLGGRGSPWNRNLTIRAAAARAGRSRLHYLAAFVLGFAMDAMTEMARTPATAASARWVGISK